MNNFFGKKDDEDLPHYPSLQDIYIRSKIKIEDYYKCCFSISYKSSNNQHIIDELPFWQFNNMAAYLDEIMKKESGKEESNQNDQGDMYKNAQSMISGTMQSAKSMMKMPSFKMPKMR